jgi:hypothetical protein
MIMPAPTQTVPPGQLASLEHGTLQYPLGQPTSQ